MPRLDVFQFVCVILCSMFAIQVNAGSQTVSTIMLDAGTSLEFTVGKFNKAKSQVTDCGGGYICLINKKPYWGSDGAVPVASLIKLVLNLKGKNITLDTTGMYNPMISKIDKRRYQVINYYDDVWKVRGWFSDGGATYYAEWLVANGQSMRVVIGGTEFLYDTFNYIFKKN